MSSRISCHLPNNELKDAFRIYKHTVYIAHMANFAGMQKQFDESQMGVCKFNILGCLLQTKNIPTVIVCSVYYMLYSTSTYHLECLLTDTLKLFGDIHKKVEPIVTMTYLSFSLQFC